MMKILKFAMSFLLIIVISSSVFSKEIEKDYSIRVRYVYYYIVEHFNRFEPTMAETEIVDMHNTGKFSMDSLYLSLTYTFADHFVHLQMDSSIIFSDTVRLNSSGHLIDSDFVLRKKRGSKLKIKVDSSKIFETYLGRAPFLDIYFYEDEKLISIFGTNLNGPTR